MNKWALLIVGALFLVWGIGVGAGLMYMFDPDRGSRRRRYVKNRAQDMMENANDVISDRASDLRDQASSRIPDRSAFKMPMMGSMMKKVM